MISTRTRNQHPSTEPPGAGDGDRLVASLWDKDKWSGDDLLGAFRYELEELELGAEESTELWLESMGTEAFLLLARGGGGGDGVAV